MRIGVGINVADAVADVDTIIGALQDEVPQIVKAAGRRYLARAQADTPINRRPKKVGRKPLASGWQYRDEGDSVRVVNVRPHASLVALGFQHVSGKVVGRKTQWIASAVDEREDMRQQLADVLPRLNGRLRALEVTR